MGFFTFHIVAGLPQALDLVNTQCTQTEMGLLLDNHDNDGRRDEDNRHRGQHRPALPDIPDHAAKDKAQRSGNQKIAASE